jgi:hypothetical protein
LEALRKRKAAIAANQFLQEYKKEQENEQELPKVAIT